MIEIGAKTKLYGVIGHPLAHTLSPAIHNAAFEVTGTNAVYLAFDTLSLKNAIDGLMAIGCRGLSVTIPYKEEIIEYLDHVDPMAGIIGSVNTLVNENGDWVGYNTDATGAMRAIEEVSMVWGKNCVIIGAGGAARAIAFALKEKGCPLTIVNRSRNRGERLARDLDAEYLPLQEIKGIETDILVQATSVGMYPDIHKMPIDPTKIGASIVMDVVYNPAETLFLRQYRLLGAITIPGARMFVYQAAEQFELWTGVSAPIEVMQRALLEAF